LTIKRPKSRFDGQHFHQLEGSTPASRQAFTRLPRGIQGRHSVPDIRLLAVLSFSLFREFSSHPHHTVELLRESLHRLYQVKFIGMWQLWRSERSTARCNGKAAQTAVSEIIGRGLTKSKRLSGVLLPPRYGSGWRA